MKPLHLCVMSCALAAAAGCTSTKGYELPAGLYGAVTYACTGFADPSCDGVFPEPAPLSNGYSELAPIAVGATFGIDGGASLAPARLEDVRPEVMRPTESGIAALGSGDAIRHIEARVAEAIRITHEIVELDDTFVQIFGEDQFSLRLPQDRFRATLVDAGGHVLVGDAGCSWTSTDSSVVSVASDPARNIVTFRVEGPGQAVLRVEMADLTRDIPFNVN
ncbi:MAG: hypothetical protein IT373_18240 [Polyangiaceae bacterium]|nr:hypothetical protein [Polyangiaceae bacterium]